MVQLRLSLSRKVGFGAFALTVISAPLAHAQSTFTSMGGAWSGNGMVHLRGGTQERIRCGASYDPSSNGQSLKLELRCASDTWNFDLSGSVVQNGISISGAWFESVNRVGGRITGQYNGGVMQARAEGDIVAALLTVQTTAARQSFLMEAPGAWAEQVSIDISSLICPRASAWRCSRAFNPCGQQVPQRQRPA
jgi:hypothetical protein